MKALSGDAWGLVFLKIAFRKDHLVRTDANNIGVGRGDAAAGSCTT